MEEVNNSTPGQPAQLAKTKKLRLPNVLHSPLLLIMAVLLSIVVATGSILLIYIGHASRYSTTTLQNGSFTYTFLFSNSVQTRKIDDTNYLYGHVPYKMTGIVMVAKPTNDVLFTSCEVLGAEYKQAFITKGPIPSLMVCTDEGKSYSTLVTQADGNHLVELFAQHGKSNISTATAEKIFNSLEITKQ